MRDVQRLQAELLQWYDSHARDMPWRASPSPYHVLLSEFMLQQTRVETVIPYFERFVERWPSLHDLAAASEDDVLGAWAGLGYYRRARFLHRAARAASEAGGLPSDPAELRKLPGVGAYTAGAIASIAWGVPTPLVDGNVERVLARLHNSDEVGSTTPGRKWFWARAAELVHQQRPGAMNQALMELGATLCTPRKPACEQCPWRWACQGQHRAEQLPVKAPKKRPQPIREVAGVVRLQDRWLLGKRPPGLLGGLWEPPRAPLLEGESIGAAAVRAVCEATSLQGTAGRSLGVVTHVFTHRRLTLDLVEVVAEGVPTAGTYEEVAWSLPGEQPVSRLAQKVFDAVESLQLDLYNAVPASRGNSDG